MADRAAEGGGIKIPFQEGMIQRALTAAKYMLSGVSPTTWFGPSQPSLPVAPEEVRGRALDYPAGYNTATQPRNAEPVSLSQMRRLADAYDVLRLVIETRKDQLAKLKWNVREREENARKDKKSGPDPRTTAVKAFLAQPDRRNTWDQWLRMILEDMLVIDAVAICPRMTRGGQLYALDVIAGETIKRVIDDTGRTPVPPDPAYQQVLHGVPAVNYTADEMIYYMRNVRSWKFYGFGPVEQIIITVNIAIRRQLFQLSYYTEGNVPEALCEVPEGWSPDQISAFQEWWDSIMEGNLGQRRHMKFVPAGANIHETKAAGLKDEMDEWLARVVCFAFSISPQPFVKEMNRATAQTAQEAALQEGLAPLQLWVKNLMDLIIAKYFRSPDLEFCWEEETSVSARDQADINDQKVRNGTMTINEAREADGREPYPDGMGAEPMIFTAAGPVLLKDIINPPEPPPQLTPKGQAEGKEGDRGNAEEAQAGHQEGEDKAGREGEGRGAGEVGGEGDGEVAKLEKAARKGKVKPIDRNRKAVRAARAGLKGLIETALSEGLKEALALTEDMGKAEESVEARVKGILAKLKLEGYAVIMEDVETVLATVTRDAGYRAFIQIGMSEEKLTSTVRERALQYAKDRSAQLIADIRESTRDMLRSDVARAIEEGWSTQELASALNENYAFSEGRAEMIARTEIADADVQGNMEAYRRSGVVTGKQWIMGSGEGCEECAANEAKGVIPLDDVFPSGDDAPPAHPNCVCDVLPVLGEEGENE